MIEETAGQLFRDIALAIMVSVGLSMVVSLTLIPTAAARFLTQKKQGSESSFDQVFGAKIFQIIGTPFRPLTRLLISLPAIIGAMIHWLTTTTLKRVTVIMIFILVTSFGVKILHRH